MSDAVFQAATIPQPGFSDPSSDSQAVFRAILNAFSYPGRKFSITTSQLAAMLRASAWPSSDFRSTTIDRLPRLVSENSADSPSRNGPIWR